MKNFNNDYIYSVVLNEGLSDIFKGFWNWLIGKNLPGKYDPTSPEYSENDLKNLVKSYSKESISFVNCDRKHIADIVEHNKKSDSSKYIYDTTKDFLVKSENNNINYKYGVFIFKSKEIPAITAAIVSYTLTSVDSNTTLYIQIIDINPVFKNHLTSDKLYNEFKSIARKEGKTQILFKNNISKSIIDDFKNNDNINLEYDKSNSGYIIKL